MAVKEREPKNLGVLLIDFSPVVREGLQAILTKDERIKVIGDAPDEQQALLTESSFLDTEINEKRTASGACYCNILVGQRQG
jgi:hypothetical protein